MEIKKEDVFSGRFFEEKGLDYLATLIQYYRNRAVEYNYSKGVVEEVRSEVNLIINHLDKHLLADLKEIAVSLLEQFEEEYLTHLKNKDGRANNGEGNGEQGESSGDLRNRNS